MDVWMDGRIIGWNRRGDIAGCGCAPAIIAIIAGSAGASEGPSQHVAGWPAACRTSHACMHACMHAWFSCRRQAAMSSAARCGRVALVVVRRVFSFSSMSVHQLNNEK
jgi:hypothetical protein